MSPTSRAFRLGVFVVATLLIFAAGIFWIGSKRFLFSSTYTLNADFENVGGLSEGAEVHVGGLHQGSIKHIDLPHRPDQKVHVVMDLKSATRDVIKKDSVAAIRSEGMVGDKYVEISFGSNGAPKVNDGDTIQSEPPVQMSDLIKKTDGLLESAKDTMQSVEYTADNLESITSKINRGSGTVGALVNNKAMYQHVNAAASAFEEDAEALKHNFLLRGFFKKRGYEDTAELAKHAISQLPTQPYSKKFVFDASKIFDKPDSAKLKDEKALNEAGDFLEANPFGLAVVAAYTDMKGDTDKDRVFTEARAMVVREYLVENFRFDDTRLKTIGLGKSPEVTGGKVEILVYPAGTTGAAAPNRATTKR
jgi:phospholipid/cholesterol/gamma-HCH transport system substrate-binding protein